MNSSEYLWYACYGSNLLADSFKVYILGGFGINGAKKDGCTDKSMWKESKWRFFPGSVYFANVSNSWHGFGVAFYDPKGNDQILMRLYKVTQEQLLEIREQESNRDRWYANIFHLGDDEDGCPIYTLTCNIETPLNRPSELYKKTIREGLREFGEMDETQITEYMDMLLSTKNSTAF